MAILRGMGVDRSVALATTASDPGIDSVEVPLQSSGRHRRANEDGRPLRTVGRASISSIKDP